MEYFPVIDIETTWSNEVMSIGVVIADVHSMIPICAECYIVDPAYKEGGMYSSVFWHMARKINTWIQEKDVKIVLIDY